jgi:hypothetical protein
LLFGYVLYFAVYEKIVMGKFCRKTTERDARQRRAHRRDGN